jgi:hypothetical protein
MPSNPNDRPAFQIRRIDLIRQACREDPAFGLPPAAKLDRIALLASWAVDLLGRKAAARGVSSDELLREQAARAYRRRPGRTADA